MRMVEIECGHYYKFDIEKMRRKRILRASPMDTRGYLRVDHERTMRRDYPRAEDHYPPGKFQRRKQS